MDFPKLVPGYYTDQPTRILDSPGLKLRIVLIPKLTVEINVLSTTCIIHQLIVLVFFPLKTLSYNLKFKGKEIIVNIKLFL